MSNTQELAGILLFSILIKYSISINFWLWVISFIFLPSTCHQTPSSLPLGILLSRKEALLYPWKLILYDSWMRAINWCLQSGTLHYSILMALSWVKGLLLKYKITCSIPNSSVQRVLLREHQCTTRTIHNRGRGISFVKIGILAPTLVGLNFRLACFLVHFPETVGHFSLAS